MTATFQLRPIDIKTLLLSRIPPLPPGKLGTTFAWETDTKEMINQKVEKCKEDRAQQSPLKLENFLLLD